MKIENLFVNVLAYDKLDVNLDRVLKFCEELPQTDPGRKVSNEGGYQSNIFDMTKTNALVELHTKIMERVHGFHNYMGFKPSVRKIVDQCWVNINPPGTYNSMHTHQGGVFTGIYYVKVPEGSGNLQMVSPIPPFDFVVKDHQIETPNHFNCSNVMITPVEDHLYLFPCWIPHQVKMNLSTDTRISIAFDIELQ